MMLVCVFILLTELAQGLSGFIMWQGSMLASAGGIHTRLLALHAFEGDFIAQ